MHLDITVKYHSDPRTGAGKLRAKGGGKQVTIPYPHECASRLKYWHAAEPLVDRIERAKGVRLRLVGVRVEPFVFTSEVFTFEVFDQTVPHFANGEAVNLDRLPAGYAR